MDIPIFIILLKTNIWVVLCFFCCCFYSQYRYKHTSICIFIHMLISFSQGYILDRDICWATGLIDLHFWQIVPNFVSKVDVSVHVPYQ